jgi:hypothetical protein
LLLAHFNSSLIQSLSDDPALYLDTFERCSSATAAQNISIISSTAATLVFLHQSFHPLVSVILK